MKKKLFITAIIVLIIIAIYSYYKKSSEGESSSDNDNSSGGNSNTNTNSNSSTNNSSNSSSSIQANKPLVSANRETVRAMQRMLNTAIVEANKLGINNVPARLAEDGVLGNKTKTAYVFAKNIYMGNNQTAKASDFSNSLTLENVEDLLINLYQKYNVEQQESWFDWLNWFS